MTVHKESFRIGKDLRQRPVKFGVEVMGDIYATFSIPSQRFGVVDLGRREKMTFVIKPLPCVEPARE